MLFKIEGRVSQVALLFLIKIASVFFATQIFAKFTPLIDSLNYLNGYYLSDLNFRTQLIQWFAFFANKSIGEVGTHFLFGSISLIGFVYYFIKCKGNIFIYLFLLLPSSLVWTSVVGKEAIYFGMLSLTLVLWFLYISDSLSKPQWGWVILLLTICFALRPHYTISISWMLFSAFIIKNVKHCRVAFLVCAFIALLVLIYYFIWFDLLWRGYGAIDPIARSSRYGVFEIPVGTLEGFVKYCKLLPLAGVMGIIGPLPSEILKRPEFIPFFVEGICILFAPVVMYYFANRAGALQNDRVINNFIFGVCPSILLLVILHSPFGILNPGTATRWRVNFELIFYFAPFLLFYGRVEDHPVIPPDDLSPKNCYDEK